MMQMGELKSESTIKVKGSMNDKRDLLFEIFLLDIVDLFLERSNEAEEG